MNNDDIKKNINLMENRAFDSMVGNDVDGESAGGADKYPPVGVSREEWEKSKSTNKKDGDKEKIWKAMQDQMRNDSLRKLSPYLGLDVDDGSAGMSEDIDPLTGLTEAFNTVRSGEGPTEISKQNKGAWTKVNTFPEPSVEPNRETKMSSSVPSPIQPDQPRSFPKASANKVANKVVGDVQSPYSQKDMDRADARRDRLVNRIKNRPNPDTGELDGWDHENDKPAGWSSREKWMRYNKIRGWDKSRRASQVDKIRDEGGYAYTPKYIIDKRGREVDKFTKKLKPEPLHIKGKNNNWKARSLDTVNKHYTDHPDYYATKYQLEKAMKSGDREKEFQLRDKLINWKDIDGEFLSGKDYRDASSKYQAQRRLNNEGISETTLWKNINNLVNAENNKLNEETPMDDDTINAEEWWDGHFPEKEDELSTKNSEINTDDTLGDMPLLPTDDDVELGIDSDLETLGDMPLVPTWDKEQWKAKAKRQLETLRIEHMNREQYGKAEADDLDSLLRNSGIGENY